MIFQEPNPLPMSIARNMAFPLKLAGIRDKSIIEARMHQALEQAFLWEEVKDRLEKSALDLSGGQKQRLCVARALVLEPEVLLCDEPTSSLDAKASAVIEELLVHLKSQCTILAVSHNPEQVRRIADRILALQEGGILPMEAGYKLMDKNKNFKTDRD
jgi:phosphate transport system ATP-binding protein